MKREVGKKPHHLLRSYWQLPAAGKESVFFMGVTSGRLTMLQGVGPYPREFGEHKLDLINLKILLKEDFSHTLD